MWVPPSGQTGVYIFGVGVGVGVGEGVGEGERETGEGGSDGKTRHRISPWN
jgi:hypothetical protein